MDLLKIGTVHRRIGGQLAHDKIFSCQLLDNCHDVRIFKKGRIRKWFSKREIYVIPFGPAAGLSSFQFNLLLQKRKASFTPLNNFFFWLMTFQHAKAIQQSFFHKMRYLFIRITPFHRKISCFGIFFRTPHFTGEMITLKLSEFFGIVYFFNA